MLQNKIAHEAYVRLMAMEIAAKRNLENIEEFRKSLTDFISEKPTKENFNQVFKLLKNDLSISIKYNNEAIDYGIKKIIQLKLKGA